jgi:hypothetical protein
MNSKIITGLGIVVVGAIIYNLKFSKKAYAKEISKLTGTDYKRYLDFERGYLKARADAVVSGADEYQYKGKTYLTKNGRLKQ